MFFRHMEKIQISVEHDYSGMFLAAANKVTLAILIKRLKRNLDFVVEMPTNEGINNIFILGNNFRNYCISSVLYIHNPVKLEQSGLPQMRVILQFRKQNFRIYFLDLGDLTAVSFPDQ